MITPPPRTFIELYFSIYGEDFPSFIFEVFLEQLIEKEVYNVDSGFFTRLYMDVDI